MALVMGARERSSLKFLHVLHIHMPQAVSPHSAMQTVDLPTEHASTRTSNFDISVRGKTHNTMILEIEAL